MTGVAVEKLDLSENRPKRSDQKCIGDRRKSFIGHPDATHFRRKFCERVFQQLRLLTTTINPRSGRLLGVTRAYAEGRRAYGPRSDHGRFVPLFDRAVAVCSE